MSIYCFDLDGTLCDTPKASDGSADYPNATPLPQRIAAVNELYEDAHIILIDSARGSESGKDWTDFTKAQLAAWGVQYHQVRTGIKFYATHYIDDRAERAEDFFCPV